MLIISKIHDYYDTALAHGIDKTCVYQRESKFIPLGGCKKLKSWGWPKRDWNREKEFLFQCIVGFAGELFPMICWADCIFGLEPDVDGVDTYQFFYDVESCTEFLDEKYPENREWANKHWQPHPWDVVLNMSDYGLDEFYDTSNHKEYERIFVEHKVPVFCVTASWSGRKGTLIELNPLLKRIKFQKVKDPYSAMQEIHMYLSGVIGMADRDTAEVGNDDRIKQRGFDKYSFRKDPTKRKPK